jgi:predicted DNA-binding transcriptional regulator AlpA
MSLTQLVRAHRVQTLLDVSAWTLNRWIREEKFPVERIEGVGRRFDLAKVQEWIDARRKTKAE